jgi:hypothetical protein
MSNVVKLEPGESMPVPVVNEETAMAHMVERLVLDPTVDVGKLERVLAVHAQLRADKARREFLIAFTEMQPELPTVERNGEIKTNEKDRDGKRTGTQVKQSKYARWEDIDEACRPIYTKHGFSLSFDIEQTPERIKVIAILAHRGGHERRVPFESPIENSGSKNNTQGWGSALSYGKRYSGSAVLNIITRGEDDDGKKAGDKPTITDDQVIALRDIILAVDADEKRFAAYMGVEKLADLPAIAFDRAKAALSKKGKRS